MGRFYVESREFARPVAAVVLEGAMLEAVGDEILREVRSWCVVHLQWSLAREADERRATPIRVRLPGRFRYESDRE